jgi:aminoglycoside phosphotransferase (APT) family kinase protein
MTFVRRYTSIPVPRVWFTVHWRGCSYIYMSRASGIVLHDVWMTSTSEMRERVVQQLAGYVEQLRTLKSPYGPIICSILRGPVWDSRLLSNGTSGPFVDEGRMNYQLRHCTPLGDWPDDIQHAHTLSHYIVLTHGDLALRNIMAQGSVVTAILDWESAGWFPAHWEYCKARFGSFDCTAATWDPLMSKFIPPYDAESAADFHLFQMHWFPSVRASFE